jgi:hypothetical protein
MLSFGTSEWAQIETLRTKIMGRRSATATVAEAAQAFVEDFPQMFSSVVLARLFVVAPLRALPAVERDFASAAASGDVRLRPDTRVLALLGTWGRDPQWRDRTLSRGHLAVPLLDRAYVENIPMLARLLADLRVDFAALDDGRAIASQPMLGGLNAKFFVPDALTAVNDRGQFVIPSRDFVASQGVRSVFGMGGAYVDGTLAVAVIFTNEVIDSLVVDRFPSLISNFKMATSTLLAQGRIFPASA